MSSQGTATPEDSRVMSVDIFRGLTVLVMIFVIFYAVCGSFYFASFAHEGWPGAARSLTFAVFILGWAAVMTRLKVRMQL